MWDVFYIVIYALQLGGLIVYKMYLPFKCKALTLCLGIKIVILVLTPVEMAMKQKAYTILQCTFPYKM